MSERKLVSPLLDGFLMGDPISSHDGVHSCPAIKENSDHKYIVKILSIPASQNQLDALLLTGAFQDAAGALNYFRELADGVVREAQLHQQLARLDGFVPCEGYQIVPMDENQLGYEVYLLTPYHRTLERQLKRSPMTHLGAVNLGLDLCAALAASRRAGFIYVDLKPSNIFISEGREYLIGDLGFISIDSLKFSSLPAKYCSRYSAPEMRDTFATVSPTADIYALGLVMYQVYNDGQLPFEDQAPEEELAPPANADYEMAEIILKACHPDPAQRWQDPTEMGQALVAYMQRNTINDVPILPPSLEEPAAEEPVEEEPAETETEAEVTAEAEQIPAEEPAAEEPADEEPAAEEPADEEPAEEPAAEEPADEEPAEEPADEEPAEEPADEEPAEEPADEEPETEATVEEAPAEAEPEDPELEEVREILAEDEADAEEVPAVEGDVVTEEVSAMLAQADELAAHELPDSIVIPEFQLPEEEPAAQPEPEAAEEKEEDADEEDEDDDDDNDVVDIPIAIPDLTPAKKLGKKWLIAAVIVALLAAIAYGCSHYYQNVYLVPVDIAITDVGADTVTATVDTAFNEAQLMAVCIDTYGNTVPAAVKNGVAQFTGLNPGTQYTLTVEIDGFNKPTGNASVGFNTIQQTAIVSISATTGAEDGSVILSFVLNGADPDGWTVEYAAAGQDPQSLDFTGHVVTIPGLTVGENYTFRLIPRITSAELQVVGENTLEFTASRVILAENVGISAFADGGMTISWNAPADAQVDEWTVYCTDGADYDQTLTVTDCAARFEGIVTGNTYIVEVLAKGMTQSARAEVTPQPLTVTDVSCAPVGGSLRVTWAYEGDAPAEGWTISYSISGGEAQTLTSDTNSADLPLLIPGASYEITVAGVTTGYQAPAAERFSGHGLTAGDLQHSFCVTPDEADWDHKDVKDYTADFSAGQSISLVVYTPEDPGTSGDETQVLYLIKDANGNIRMDLAACESMSWKDMWNKRYFYPTLPSTPDEAGTYTAEIYFDGALAISKRFTIN